MHGCPSVDPVAPGRGVRTLLDMRDRDPTDDPRADAGDAADEAPPAEPPARANPIRRALGRQARFVRRVRSTLPPRSGPLRAVPDIRRGDGSADGGRCDPDGRALLKVMTLNLAHGRSTGFHQALKLKRTIRRNLGAVAEVLRRERPDVVAFQEADGPSFWSGGFDHVDFIADASDLRWRMRGRHVVAPRMQYGTALATRLPLDAPLSVSFAPSPPTFTKGFVVATVTHPEAPDCPIDVVSVHLDFARAAIRRRQVETLIDELRARDRLRVVVGDFNTTWGAREGALRRLAEALGLRCHDPEAPLITFPFHKSRLDWIFVSRALEITEHRVLPDVISDHRGVLAGLRLP